MADKPPPAGASAPPGAPAPGLQLEVASLTLSQAQVLWRDEQTGSQVSLKDLQLRSGQLQADAARAHTLQLQQLMLSTKGSLAPMPLLCNWRYRRWPCRASSCRRAR